MHEGLGYGDMQKLILVIPYAALALLAVAATLRATPEARKSHSRQQSRRDVGPDSRADAGPLGSPDEPRAELTAVQAVSDAHKILSSPPISPAATTIEPSDQIQTSSSPTTYASPRERPSEKTELAAFHLIQAREALSAARLSDAADELRNCIRAAVATKNGPLHAEARLELAELARAAGDLTSACEHWQIARSLFHEIKNKEALAKAEGLMRRHGCPTDWVLNDF